MLKKYKILSLLAGVVFPVFLIPACLILVPYVLIRSRVYRKRYYIRKEKSDFMGNHTSWHFSEIHGRSYGDKKVNMEAVFPSRQYGWEIDVNGDGEDGREVMLSAWVLWFKFYITFANFIPERFMPKNAYFGTDKRTGESCFGWSLHDWCSWFHWNSDPNCSPNNGFDVTIDFVRLLKGVHYCKWEILGMEEHKIAMYEGAYNVVVLKKLRIDTWQRWFTKKRVQWECVCGTWEDFDGFDKGYNSGWYIYSDNMNNFHYRGDQVFKYNGQPSGDSVVSEYGDEFKAVFIAKKLKESFVPVPGKGENSWDCGEGGTCSISFGVDSGIRTYIDAANRFQASVQETRVRYGGRDWLPERYRGLEVNTIR